MTTPSTAADPLATVEYLRNELGEGVAIIGGGAAPSDLRAVWEDSYQFWNDTVAQDAVPILLFSGPLNYSIGVDTGWKPVGPKGVITRASPSVIHEIDGLPAVEFYERYLGAGVEPAIANPLAVFADGSEEFFLRAPTQYDRETGSIAVFGGVPEHTRVQLTIAGADDIFEGTKAAVSKAVAAYQGGSQPEAAFVVSCAVRKFLLGTKTEHEVELARGLLGEGVPLCGFYSAGEIAPIDGGDATRFLNETIVAVLMGT